MKKFLLALLLVNSAIDAASQTLHAILVSDVQDAKLGGISQRDEEKIVQLLKNAE